MSKSYSELLLHRSFEDRLTYLLLGGGVGEETFGSARFVNQGFYHSREWKQVRSQVIIRDNGCDLGVPGFEIYSEPLVHHMNPVSLDDLVHGEDWILDPEYLITTTQDTHNQIHYGRVRHIPRLRERRPGDTKLW